MKIAYKHILQNINSAPSIKDISNKLLQLGHEHEIENEIFNMEFTPNRGDCLSLQGLLRDLSCFYKIKKIEDIYQKDFKEFEMSFINEEEQTCPKISFLKMEISNDIKPYHGVLKDYFDYFKINKNNFFTDISNYISYEMGQPTHCYDCSKMEGNLFFKKINHDHEFNTLLDKEINLVDENYVFVLEDKIINLAGIIGDKYTSCSEKTREAIIECAYFKPESVIGKSVKYDIQSEASYKFERGVDPNCHEMILRRFIKIVEDHVDIKNIELFTKEYKKFQDVEIPYNLNAINNILGMDISEKTYKDNLNKLGFCINGNNILIPSYRGDIKTQNDLAEEVARVIGYDNINIKEIKIVKKNNKEDKLAQKVKSLLIDNGFYEVINFPFVKESTDKSILVDNPLDSNKKYLRTSLKESLIENLLFNERRQKDSIKLFEISDIYCKSSPIEKESILGLIASGRVDNNYEDFSKKITDEYLYKILKNYTNQHEILIEEISRNTLDSKSKNKIFYCEFKIDKFLSEILEYDSITEPLDHFVKYEPISELPVSNRDLSYSLNDYSKLQDLQDMIFSYRNDILKDVFIFDFYKNTNLNEIKIGFRFIFQSKDKTITDEEVDNVLNDIINLSLSIKNVKIPGLKDGN